MPKCKRADYRYVKFTSKIERIDNKWMLHYYFTIYLNNIVPSQEISRLTFE